MTSLIRIIDLPAHILGTIVNLLDKLIDIYHFRLACRIFNWIVNIYNTTAVKTVLTSMSDSYSVMITKNIKKVLFVRYSTTYLSLYGSVVDLYLQGLVNYTTRTNIATISIDLIYNKGVLIKVASITSKCYNGAEAINMKASITDKSIIQIDKTITNIVGNILLDYKSMNAETN